MIYHFGLCDFLRLENEKNNESQKVKKFTFIARKLIEILTNKSFG